MQKEPYFTLETIEEKSHQMLTAVSAVRRRHADIIFQPERAALLVLDLQKYFLAQDSHAFIRVAFAI